MVVCMGQGGERQSPKIHELTKTVERLKLEKANVYWDRKSVFFF